jgi:uncharacterized HAD superfamily protein
MDFSSKTIYVDLDDVLCQAARHFLMIVEREFGKKVEYDQLTDFDVGHSCGLTSTEREKLYEVVHRPDELLSMAPIGEAIEALKRWEDQGFDVAIVTGRPPDSYDASIQWLAKHRIAYSSFTVVDKYSRFATENTIAISLAELAARRFRWAVEDSLPMAQYLAGAMNVPVALIDCPWNRADAEHPGINRFRNWRAIADGVAPLAGRCGDEP